MTVRRIMILLYAASRTSEGWNSRAMAGKLFLSDFPFARGVKDKYCKIYMVQI